MQQVPLAVPIQVTEIVTAPWHDKLVEAYGYTPMSTYIEQVYLGFLGPSSTWMYRYLATPLLGAEEVVVDLNEMALSLGLGNGLGAHSPVRKSLFRLCHFGIVRWAGTRLLVRNALAPLSTMQVARLSRHAQEFHRRSLSRR